MGKTYVMQERGKTCKEIFGTNTTGIIKHNIKMYNKEVFLENTGQILMAQDRSSWLVLLNKVTKLCGSYRNPEIFNKPND